MLIVACYMFSLSDSSRCMIFLFSSALTSVPVRTVPSASRTVELDVSGKLTSKVIVS
jgi:hypothetical protein